MGETEEVRAGKGQGRSGRPCEWRGGLGLLPRGRRSPGGLWAKEGWDLTQVLQAPSGGCCREDRRGGEDRSPWTRAEGTAPVQVSNDGTGPGGDRGVGRFGIEFKGRVFMHFLRI